MPLRSGLLRLTTLTFPLTTPFPPRPPGPSLFSKQASKQPQDMSTTTAIFQTSRTATLVPAEARNKKQLRAVVAAFAEQFAAALANRLVTYCRLSRTKTVTSDTLRAVAEELLGAGSTTLPDGIDEARLPQTIIYSRFKRNLNGYRTDSKCASVAAIVGAHFLRYVRDLLDRVYVGAEDPRAITVQQVIASLERPGKYSPSGLPCLAYRHDDAIFAQPEAAAAAASEEGEGEAAPKKEKKAGKKQKQQEQGESGAGAAAVEEKKASKKRARKEEAEVAAPEPVAVVAEQPAAKKARAPKKAKEAAAEDAQVSGQAAEPKKRRAPAKKASAAAAAEATATA